MFDSRQTGGYQEISPEEVGEWTKRGARLIDVRERWEYAWGHIPGAENVPLRELLMRAGELKGPVVLICATGNRSGQAAELLSENGLDEVANLVGGTAGWVQRGHPLE
ncbi:MAG: rhodanese-like domain-containing protein [Actinomycetota bacterium]